MLDLSLKILCSNRSAITMPPRQQSTSNLPNSNCSNHADTAKLAPEEQFVSLQSLMRRNSIATFDPMSIYNADQATDCRISEEGSAICTWLTGRNVLVSGASGFLGKVLLEKLLRACQRLGRVYVIVRAKGGRSTDQRVEELLNEVIFTKLLRLQPKFKNKVIGINGDISLPNLGMSNEDRAMITKHVSVIFHVAATVNFDAPLKAAVDVNVRGSAAMLQLGRECGAQLASYVHVSSTYANCTRAAVGEAVYEAPMAPAELIALAEQLDPATLEHIKAKILGEYPNTYSFTKCVAEQLVAEESAACGVPACIFRPAIVVSTYREPLRGWTDNLYGPTGVFTGAGLGLIRTLHCDPAKLADIVPADMVVNCMIAAAHRAARPAPTTTTAVYNYVSSTQRPIRWSEICAFVQYYGLETPSVQAVWYFCFRLNRHRLVHRLHVLLLHWLPALLVDGARVCLRREPKLTRLYTRIHKFLRVISYFSVKEWQFSNENVRELWRGLGAADRAAFPFSMDHLDWDEHSQTHALGLRTYLMKEDLATLPQARRRWNRLYYLHRFVQVVAGFLVLSTACFTSAYIYHLF